MTSFSCFQRYDELGVIPNFSDRFFNVQENSFGMVCIHMYDSGLFREPRKLCYLLRYYLVISFCQKKTPKIFRENIMNLKNQPKLVISFSPDFSAFNKFNESFPTKVWK